MTNYCNFTLQGNYTIMAKRLQYEIKNIEQEVQEMKARLNQEIEVLHYFKPQFSLILNMSVMMASKP